MDSTIVAAIINAFGGVLGGIVVTIIPLVVYPKVKSARYRQRTIKGMNILGTWDGE